nr:MAG TPA: Z DNA-binding protein [Caudoviricetes sp.]
MRERIKKEPPKQSYQINQVKSSRIARNCQLGAYKLRPGGRQWLVFGILEQYGAMTAREVCSKLGSNDMNYVRPRLTELVQMGKIEIIGKKRDEITDRSTSIYQVIRGEENEQNTLEEDE